MKVFLCRLLRGTVQGLRSSHRQTLFLLNKSFEYLSTCQTCCSMFFKSFSESSLFKTETLDKLDKPPNHSRQSLEGRNKKLEINFSFTKRCDSLYLDITASSFSSLQWIFANNLKFQAFCFNSFWNWFCSRLFFAGFFRWFCHQPKITEKSQLADGFQIVSFIALFIIYLCGHLNQHEFDRRKFRISKKLNCGIRNRSASEKRKLFMFSIRFDYPKLAASHWGLS